MYFHIGIEVAPSVLKTLAKVGVGVVVLGTALSIKDEIMSRRDPEVKTEEE